MRNLFKVRKDWKWILRRAWSVKLILVAGLLTGLEVFLPLIFDHGLLVFAPWVYPVAMLALTMAALIARVIAQEGFD